MAKSRTTLFAAGVTCLGFVCLALSSTAIGIPVWGYYETPTGGYEFDRGYFGPFKVCKQLSYNREKCGSDVSKFKLTSTVYVSGLLNVFCSAALGIFCILSVIQIAMISSREKVVMPYKSLVLSKMILSFVACILAVIATILFALQIDDFERHGFRISRGISFFIQIIAIVLMVVLVAFSIYDTLYSRKPGVDPTIQIDGSSVANATTYSNPGFKEPRSSRNGKTGVSVTDASGKPYSGISDGGSIVSINTTITSVSNGSTVDAVSNSPLRSSLKKPRVPRSDASLGIQNPGFSSASTSSSPPINRNGSVKKVRIQTHSTEV